jgi:hypothetical protein
VVVFAGKAIIPSFAGIFAVLFFINIQDLNADAVRYPNVIIPVIIALALLNAITEGMQVSKLKARTSRSTNSALARNPAVMRPMAVVALVAVFSYAIPRMGFYPAAFGFLLLTPWALGMRRLRSSVATSLGVGLSAYLLFEVVLGLTLPQRGWLL